MGESLLVRKAGGGGAKIEEALQTFKVASGQTITAGKFVDYITEISALSSETNMPSAAIEVGVKIIKLSETKAFMIYRRTDNNISYKCRYVFINNNVITFGTEQNLSSNTLSAFDAGSLSKANDLVLIKNDTNTSIAKVVVFYRLFTTIFGASNDRVYYKVLSLNYSNNTITFGTETALRGTETSAYSLYGVQLSITQNDQILVLTSRVSPARPLLITLQLLSNDTLSQLHQTEVTTGESELSSSWATFLLTKTNRIVVLIYALNIQGGNAFRMIHYSYDTTSGVTTRISWFASQIPQYSTNFSPGEQKMFRLNDNQFMLTFFGTASGILSNLHIRFTIYLYVGDTIIETYSLTNSNFKRNIFNVGISRELLNQEQNFHIEIINKNKFILIHKQDNLTYFVKTIDIDNDYQFKINNVFSFQSSGIYTAPSVFGAFLNNNTYLFSYENTANALTKLQTINIEDKVITPTNKQVFGLAKTGGTAGQTIEVFVKE